MVLWRTLRSNRQGGNFRGTSRTEHVGSAPQRRRRGIKFRLRVSIEPRESLAVDVGAQRGIPCPRRTRSERLSTIAEAENEGPVRQQGLNGPRQIRTLENRLDKAMIKYNEAQSIRKTYDQIVKRLKEERVNFGMLAC